MEEYGMKSIKRVAAGVAALSMVLGLAACGGKNGETPEATTAATEGTTAVSINTDGISDEEQGVIDNTTSALRDVELENKTIKWIATWDINPDSTGKSEPVALSMFKTKYGGNVKWYQTTFDTRYTDLSTYVLGGEGIDFFQRDNASLPNGIVNGMFCSVDDYIDINDELWSHVKEAMEVYNFNGKHYAFITGVSADNVVIYSTKTIEENGYDDPWDLYQNGEWNWDTFTEMLEDFCDPEEGREGLDGWWTENALLLSAGVPTVKAVDGQLQTNLEDPTIEKAMNWMTTLYNKGLILPKEQYDWSEQPQFMGEGRELFYITGSWALMKTPETWTFCIPPEEVAIVPVPSPADSDPYQMAALNGFCLVKGGDNPLGVALYSECEILAQYSDDATELYAEKTRSDYSWTDSLIEQYNEVNRLANEYPVVDLAAGVSTDVSSLTTDGGEQTGLRAAMHGYEWATTREQISETVNMLVEEVNQKLIAQS